MRVDVLASCGHGLEPLGRLFDDEMRTRRQTGAHFPQRSRFLGRGDAIEDRARGRPGARPPGRRERGDEHRLRAQDDPVLKRLQPIRRKRRAGRGDVDDELRGASGRRALGCAQALDDAIIGDALLGEKPAGEVHVFGCDPHPFAAPGAIGGGDVLEIGHGAHVDPGFRRGDHDIGMAEPKRAQELEPGADVRDLLAQQILAGDAEMGCAGGELADDLGARDIGDLDSGKTAEGAAIVARAAPLDEFEAGAGEKGGRAFLQPALRGDRQNEGRLGGSLGVERHQSLPPFGNRSIAMAAPTAGMSWAEPRRFASPS